jgi:hypothetical protein
VPRTAPDAGPAVTGTARRRHVVAALDAAGLWFVGESAARPVETMPASRAACAELAAAAGVDRLFVYPDAAGADLPDSLPLEQTVRHPWADLAGSAFTSAQDAGTTCSGRTP